MRRLAIVKAELPAQFRQAKAFVLPYERIACTLMQKILNEDSVYLAVDEASAGTAGVFYFKNGSQIIPFFPAVSDGLKQALKDFLKDKTLFCVLGDEQSANLVAACAAGGQKIAEIREFFLMEYHSRPYLLHHAARNLCIKKCMGNSAGAQTRCKEADLLMPLQLAYIQEEVLSSSETPNVRLERMNLERALRTQSVYMALLDNTLAGKAQTNAVGVGVVQVGGVYTRPAYRGQGVACALVRALAEDKRAEGKGTVLYVNKTNRSAIRAYTRAGFAVTDVEYRILYYAED